MQDLNYIGLHTTSFGCDFSAFGLEVLRVPCQIPSKMYHILFILPAVVVQSCLQCILRLDFCLKTIAQL